MADNLSPLEVVQRVFEAASAEAARSLFCSDAVATSWEKPGVTIRGFANINREFFLSSEAAFDNSHFDFRHLVETGNLVFVDAIFSAVFVREYHGIRPHGRQVAWPMRDVFQVDEGKITRLWFGSDTLAVARELGVVDSSFKLFA